MANFPEFDPETLAQAIKTFILSRQNVLAAPELNRPDFFEVIRGIAEGVGQVHNPSFAALAAADQTLLNLVNQGSGGSAVTPTLLYQTQGPVSEGQWVVQVSDDTVSTADSNSFADGPVVGVVIEIPSTGFARVQTTGSYTYNATNQATFLPLTTDSTYYASDSLIGGLTTSPNPSVGGFLQELGFAKTQYQFVITVQEPTAV